MSVREKLTAIADSVRKRLGEDSLYTLDELAEKVSLLGPPDSVSCYDINGDGYINEDDLEALKAAVEAGSEDMTLDLNGDGIVNETDIEILQMVLLNSGYDTRPHTATENDILFGKTAILSGKVITGAHVCSAASATADATASADDILSGKTAYVNGEKLLGTHSCSSEPDYTLINSLLNKTITSFSSDTLTSIGSHAFNGCTNLTSVDLPNLTSVAGTYAFSACTKLTSISLPKAAFSASATRTFYNCISLESVDLPLLPTLDLRTSTFYNCSALKNVNLPLCKSLGAQTFVNCTSLEKISLPSFNGNAYAQEFKGCTALKKVDFGGNVNFPKTQAFQDCTALEALIMRGSTVATLANTNNFSGSKIEDGSGYIYVPASLLSTYKAAANWSTFSAQFRSIEDYPSVCG